MQWYDLGWISVTHDSGGNYHCLNLDPDLSKNGKVGQIIRTLSDGVNRELIAYAFYDFFFPNLLKMLFIVNSID